MLAYVAPFSATTIAILVMFLILVSRFEATNGFHDAADAVATVIGLPTSGSHCVGPPSGAAPASFMRAFVAAPGDKGATWLGSMRLSSLVCIPMPVLKVLGRSLL